MDLERDASRLLDRIDALRRPCDLDLLVFFARHPRAFLSSEHVAAFLGYGVKEIAASLDLLLGAGLITRTPSPVHAARLYVFSTHGANGGWLPGLLKLASTRDGRLATIWELRRRSSGGAGGPLARVERDAPTAPRPARPSLVRRRRQPSDDVQRSTDATSGSEPGERRKRGGGGR